MRKLASNWLALGAGRRQDLSANQRDLLERRIGSEISGYKKVIYILSSCNLALKTSEAREIMKLDPIDIGDSNNLR